MLVDDLDLQRHPQQAATALEWPQLSAAALFGVGALAYLLKNRFYLGEVLYRGEVHRGDHAPILEPAAVRIRADPACGLYCGAALPPARLARPSDRAPV